MVVVVIIAEIVVLVVVLVEIVVIIIVVVVVLVVAVVAEGQLDNNWLLSGLRSIWISGRILSEHCSHVIKHSLEHILAGKAVSSTPDGIFVARKRISYFL